MNLLYTKNKLLILIIPLLFLNKTELLSQEDVVQYFDLTTAKEYAVQHNYDIQSSKFNIQTAKKQLREVTANGLPQISGSVDYNNFLDIPTQLIPGEIFGGEPGSTIPVQFGRQHNATVGLTATQLIFNGSYFVGLQASRIFLRFAEENFERSKNDVLKTITQTYYLTLVAEENHKVLQQSLGNLEKTLYEVEEQHKEGFIEETDVKQLQISVRQLQNTLNMVNEQVEFTKMLLKFQMGINLEKNIVLTEKLDDILLMVNVSQVVDEKFEIERNINYRLMLTQERMAELTLRNERSKFFPTIAGFFSYQRNAQRDDFDLLENDGDWFNTTIVGVSLNVPIFNSGAKHFKVQQSKIALKQARLNKQKVEQGLLLEYNQAEITLNSAYDNYLSRKESMQLSREVYDITLEKFKEGISSSLELTQTHNQLLQSQSDYITSMSELLNAKNQLDSLYN